MPRFLRAAFAFFAAVFLVSGAANASSRVVASILPVHSLVAGVMQGIGTPQLLVAGAASPHDYALSPSSARALQSAEAVFWIGAGMESFLVKPLAALSQDAAVVAFGDNVPLLAGREGGSWEAHDEAGHNGDGHNDTGHSEVEGEHHGHEENDDQHSDMHVWLDPANAQTMVRVIVATLQKTDPANAVAYAANGETLLQRLDMLDATLRNTLVPVRKTPYVVFHDAYQYFERRYGLNAVGSLTISPDRSPGVKRLYAVRDKIQSTGARCVFAEPQFAPALVATVLEGTPARAGTLDPIGAEIPPGPDAYFTLLENLAAGLRDCLDRPG